jgi:hypothetical protein
MSPWLKSTDVALGVVEMLIPFLPKQTAPLLNDSKSFAQVTLAQAASILYRRRIKQQFGHRPSWRMDVNVRGWMIVCVEEKTQPLLAVDRRHLRALEFTAEVQRLRR